MVNQATYELDRPFDFPSFGQIAKRNLILDGFCFFSARPDYVQLITGNMAKTTHLPRITEDGRHWTHREASPRD
eukprot:13603994-Alexandrium_andersonii.AAC.1